MYCCTAAKLLRSALVYVQLEEAIFEKGDDQFISKAATTVEDVLKLVEAGFECVCDVNDAKVFRKRK
jgi:hypothetical protein